jgi:hypothetical protein
VTASPPANLVAALGPAFDGAWSWEDCDLAVVTVPSMVAPGRRCLPARAAGRPRPFHHGTQAAPRPSLLIVDEFSAIQGGRRAAIDQLERARLLAAASAVIAFRSPSSPSSPPPSRSNRSPRPLG